MVGRVIGVHDEIYLRRTWMGKYDRIWGVKGTLKGRVSKIVLIYSS